MWLMTRCGFFSVVCARGPLGEPIADLMMVRARCKAHLQALQQRFPSRLGLVPIQHTKDTDYPYRLFMAKAVVVDIAALLAGEIDYTNFKHEAAQAGDRVYDNFLHRVWGAGLGMQDSTQAMHNALFAPPAKPTRTKRAKRAVTRKRANAKRKY